jgi:acyl-CoA thioester hydrolase
VKGSPNIIRYIESARIAWLEQVGALPDPAASSEGPVIVNAYCSFLKQLTYPGEIQVTTLVGPPGRSSIEVTHQIRLVEPSGQAGALRAEGGAKVVWIDFKAEKSRPLLPAAQ